MRNSAKGWIDKKGYRRFAAPGRRRVYEHILVWEKVNGPKPIGYDIHHKNFDKQDNRIENLETLTFSHHRRLHNGWRLREGVWWRPCTSCKEILSLPSFYRGQSHCKPCDDRRTKLRKRRKSSLVWTTPSMFA